MLIQMMNRLEGKKKKKKRKWANWTRACMEPSETGKISPINPFKKEAYSLLHQDISFNMFTDESLRQRFVFRSLERKCKARTQKSKERGVRLLMLLWAVVTVSMRSRFGPTNLSWVENTVAQGSQVFVHSLLNCHAVTPYLSSKSVGTFSAGLG